MLGAGLVFVNYGVFLYMLFGPRAPPGTPFPSHTPPFLDLSYHASCPYKICNAGLCTLNLILPSYC